MEENDKPFACTVDGCKMSFTNEDHLTVHKKKHDMVLNLGIGQKSNMFVADQTPTPTRFIRNCEEVGLFQDLQNVNPFEETFRKAVEAAKSGQTHLGVDSMTVPSGADDTLHTPHVFPHIIEEQTTSPIHISSTSVITENSRRKSSSTEELDRSLQPTSTTGTRSSDNEVRSHNQRNTVKVERKEADTSQQRIVPAPAQPLLVVKNEVPETTSNVQLILRMPDGKLVQVQGVSMEQVESVPAVQVAAPATSPGTVVLDAQSTPVLQTSSAVVSSSPCITVNNKMALAKEKLKQQLIKANRGLISLREAVPKKPASNLVRVSEVNGKALSSSEGSESNSPPSRPRRCASADDIDEKRKKFLERNRAAAMRCRKKRKNWIQDLERRAEDMQRTNQTLQAEVAALRAEVAQLKTLLLAHKDCPVTHAMAQGVPAASAPQSQHIINVTVPLITQNGLVSGATASSSTVQQQQQPPQQQQQQPMLMSTVPKRQMVLLNKPSIAKRRASSNVISTSASKKPLVDDSSATPPTLLLTTSTVNTSDSVNLVSMNSRTEHKFVANGSVASNVGATIMSGTNIVLPSVVVTPSQVQNVLQTDSSLVPMSVLDHIPTVLLSKSLCLPSVGITQEHHASTVNTDSSTGITQVIKLNPNVSRTERTNSVEQIQNKNVSNGHGDDSDVEIIMEVHRESDGS